jgi:hypothetical protein
MNGPLFERYMDIFIEHSGASVDNPVILLLDNHVSHHGKGRGADNEDDDDDEALLSGTMFKSLSERGVELIMYPPNATAFFQPLDQAFGPPKAAAMGQVRVEANRGVLSAAQFIDILGQTFVSKFTPRVITAAWEKTGQWPINVNIHKLSHVVGLLSPCHDHDDKSNAAVADPVLTSIGAVMADPALNKAKLERPLAAPRLELKEALLPPAPTDPRFRGDWQQVKELIARGPVDSDVDHKVAPSGKKDELPIKCPSCSLSVAADAKFCSGCGWCRHDPSPQPRGKVRGAKGKAKQPPKPFILSSDDLGRYVAKTNAKKDAKGKAAAEKSMAKAKKDGDGPAKAADEEEMKKTSPPRGKVKTEPIQV